MQLSPPARRKAKIEVIPLIDIIFFLLATFVMVSMSMTKNEGINVALPGASSGSKMDDKEKAVTLSVNDKGDVFFNKEKVTLAQLPFKLQSYKSGVKDPKVVVNGDGEADYKMVLAVIDEAKKIGIAKVALSTKPK
jgi:biopolymer transport protein ExbD